MAVKRVEGVQDATFSFERGDGEVMYDPTRTNPEAFIAELERMTGYVATVRVHDRPSEPGVRP